MEWTYVLKLALRVIIHDRAKSLACLAGVAFSVCLVLMQQGIYHGSLLATFQVIERSRADLWVLPVGVVSFDNTLPLSETTASLIRGIRGVDLVEPMVVTFVDWKLPGGGKQGAQVVGFETRGELFRPWNIRAGAAGELSADRTVLVDGGDLGKLGASGVGDASEIRSAQSPPMGARIVGLTEGIRSLHACPILFTDIRNARAYCRMREHQMNYLLVRIDRTGDPERVRREIQGRVPYVECLTRSEFGARTREDWDRRTGIGTILFTTSAMSVAVGVGVLAMLQYLSVLDHRREHAVLRAIGAPDRRVAGLIVAQGLLLGLSGYAVGSGMSLLIGRMLGGHIAIVLSARLLEWVFVGAMTICIGVGLSCAVKALRTDPGLVFKP